jgi:serine/tyrosine/threonine adenylyltransferase
MTSRINKHIINLFTSSLPGDSEKKNFIRQVFNACYSEVSPTPPKKPSFIHFNQNLAEELFPEGFTQEELLPYLSGSKNFENFMPYAMCYGGHQFGSWAGQLGDGRAINIAEFKLDNHIQTLQLKGAGLTPYSRNADGLAVLRSSIREYLCSEAMYHLSVPTTRALSLVLTGDEVLRDMFYNGNPQMEKGAIVCRVAPNFIRFGNFQILTARKDYNSLKQLTDFTITHFFPHLGKSNKDVYLQFLTEVVQSTQQMILHWERVGFVHGVMNTDNMSVLGLTIDYGPYGWLEDYNPEWTPNTTDANQKRYRYGNQWQIALWNLVQFANAIYPLIEDAPAMEGVLNNYYTSYKKQHNSMVLSKLGLNTYDDITDTFISELENLLTASEMDMTIFFRNMNLFDEKNPILLIEQLPQWSYASSLSAYESKWKIWFNAYAKRLNDENTKHEGRIEKMNKVNPKYVLRNYMAQLAIEDAEKGDCGLVNELYSLLQKPYDEQPNMQKWFAKRPEWAKNKAGSSMLSCSS